MSDQGSWQRRDLLTAAATLGNWTIGALLLVNGGALVALLQNQQSAMLVTSAGLFFFFGLIATLLGAMLATVGFFFFAIVGEDYDRLADKTTGAEGQKLGRQLNRAGYAVVGAFFAWLAALMLFVWGAIDVRMELAQMPRSSSQVSSTPLNR